MTSEGVQSAVYIARSAFDGSGIDIADIAHTSIEDTVLHGGVGAVVDNGMTDLSVSISRCVVADATVGVFASASGVRFTEINVSNSSIANNVTGLQANYNSRIRLHASEITGSLIVGVDIQFNGQVLSTGDNMRAGNASDGAPATLITWY